jgi:hypothetical protein
MIIEYFEQIFNGLLNPDKVLKQLILIVLSIVL